MQMKLEYPTVYRDFRGVEKCTFIADGSSFTITIREITFDGHFWELVPKKGQEEMARNYFDLNDNGELSGITNLSNGKSSSGFSVNVDIPIKVVTKDNQEIDAIIEFGTNPQQLFFIIDGVRYTSESPSFEYGLARAYTQSLNIEYVKCCVNCKFSAFSPMGNQEYGDMMCFKNCKENWVEIGYIGLKDPHDWSKIAKREKTQEAYYCDEFELNEKS
jgi:hypothetical protein